MSSLGGKGYNLLILAQGGFQVPNAFIVSEEAFREYRKDLSISFTESHDMEVTDDLLSAIQDEIDHHLLKEELIAEINTQLHDLVRASPISHPLLAVRSSGVAEDLDDASFAGINETVLSVACECDSVCDAIKTCWKSLYTRRAVDYRRKNGFPSLDTSIAVVIQVMIPSDSSGVVFTVDPHTSSRAHMALDGVHGLGEALVGGLVNPDHWVIRKPYGKSAYSIEETSLQTQPFKLVSNYPQKGTSKQTLTESEGKQPAFSSDEVVFESTSSH